ncbi:MAG: hypothetical protein ACTIH2_08220, partial [Anaerococcus sp.]
MKKTRSIILIFLLTILVSCGNDTPQDITDLIVTPKKEDSILMGTWEVKDIKNVGQSLDSNPIKVGDLLYIDNNLVAINNDYALPPKFSSKYAELSKYLSSRGIDLKISSDSNVTVVNASQGQLYSKDFILFGEDELFFINDNNMIILEKISSKVENEVLEKYQAKSDKERSYTTEGEAIEVDINLFIGVRERVETYTGNPTYNYYTYSVRIEPNEPARVYKAENIYFPKKDEFWRFKTLQDRNNGKYNSFMAYPVRIEDEIDEEENQEKYTFMSSDKDMKFNFINENFISFDYTLDSDKFPIDKYAMVKTDDLEKNNILEINDYTGEEESNKVFEKVVYDEVAKNFADIEKEDIDYDYTNFGLIRNQGLWVFESSYQITKNDSLQQKSFPIDIATKDDLLIDTKKNLNV